MCLQRLPGMPLSVQTRPLVSALAGTARMAPWRVRAPPFEHPTIVRNGLAPLGILSVEGAKRVHDLVKKHPRASWRAAQVRCCLDGARVRCP